MCGGPRPDPPGLKRTTSPVTRRAVSESRDRVPRRPGFNVVRAGSRCRRHAGRGDAILIGPADGELTVRLHLVFSHVTEAAALAPAPAEFNGCRSGARGSGTASRTSTGVPGVMLIIGLMICAPSACSVAPSAVTSSSY